MRLKDKIAVVTGGAQGLGRIVSVTLAEEGANVIVCDINEKGVEETVNDIKKIGRASLGMKTDVSNEKEVLDMVGKTLEVFGRIDILVNNAGGSLNAPDSVEKTTMGDWNRVIAVNLTGTFLCCKAVLPTMQQNRSGKIVNVSSKAARTGSAITGPAYPSAKAGVIGLTRDLAFKMGPYGININCVAPMFVLTEPRFKKVWDSLPTEKREIMISAIPLGRPSEPDEQASVIVFLCTDDASYITGACIDVNGGAYMS